MDSAVHAESRAQNTYSLITCTHPYPAAPARAALASALRDPAADPSRFAFPDSAALAYPLIDLHRVALLRIAAIRAPDRGAAAVPACVFRRTASPKLD